MSRTVILTSPLESTASSSPSPRPGRIDPDHGPRRAGRRREQLADDPPEDDPPEGRALSARGKAVAEPVNRQRKHARRLRQFSLRGQVAVEAEWTWGCSWHMVLKPFADRLHGASTA